jgi:signal peptidase II
MLLYVLAAAVYGVDQVLKWLVRTHMALGQTIPVAPPVVVLAYIRNPGAAWGVLSGARWLLVVVAVLVAAGVVYAHRHYRPRGPALVGLALVLGGALGNLTDRIWSGTVVDYIYLEFIHFPVFNFADVAIDVGAVLLLWRGLLAPSRARGGQVGDEAKDVRR